MAFLTPTLSYDATNVFLNLERNDMAFAAAGTTPNQIAVGDALDSQGNSVLANQIVNLDVASARDAFDQLSGEIHASVLTVMTEDNRMVRNAVLDHLSESAGGTIWGQIWALDGSTDGDSNASGFSRDSYGALIGGDVAVGEGASVGLAASYADTGLDLTSPDNLGMGSVQTYNVLAYADVSFGGPALRVGGGYGSSSISANRSVGFGTFSDNLGADYDGTTLYGFAELGWRFAMDEMFLEPFVGVTLIDAEIDGFAESGGDAALTFADASENSTIGTMGVRFGLPIGDTFSLAGRAGFQHAFGDVVPMTRASFDTGSTFAVAGAPQTTDGGFLQLGAMFGLSENTSINISYDGFFREDSTDHAAVLRLSFGF